MLNVAKPPFDDPDARRAVALAINRDEINQIRNQGAYEVGSGPFDTSVPGFVKNNGYPKFNLAQANKLAQKYKDQNSSGPNGFKSPLKVKSRSFTGYGRRTTSAGA